MEMNKMAKARELVKNWLERKHKRLVEKGGIVIDSRSTGESVLRDLARSYNWDMPTLIVEEFGMNGEWDDEHKAPTNKQWDILDDIVVKYVNANFKDCVMVK